MLLTYPTSCTVLFSGGLLWTNNATSDFLTRSRSKASRIVTDCRRCLDLLSGRLTSVSLVWVPGHGDIPGNCRADELARAVALLPEFSSFELNIERKFVWDANLFWVNEDSYSIARFTWPLMDKRRTNKLLGFSRDIISTIHCVMGI